MHKIRKRVNLAGVIYTHLPFDIITEISGRSLEDNIVSTLLLGNRLQCRLAVLIS